MFLFTKDLLDYVEKHGIKFIDWRFTDLLGRWYHITHSTNFLDPGVFTSGVAFDSSSVPGWQPIEASDMLLVPDISTAFVDPFSAQATLSVICNVVCPGDRTDYSRDPRYTARKAHHYLVSKSIADKCFFGPEVEFFVFDRVRFAAESHNSFFKLTSVESSSGASKRFDSSHGYGLKERGGYLCSSPMDSSHDMRSEVLAMLDEVGVKPLLHHHEVASSQCEVGFHHNELVAAADSVQKCKYVLRNVVGSYGKSVTFMPKPVVGDNGSGMHCHQSLWKDGNNIFAGDNGTAGLSDTCLYYIGGILAHGKALNAFANPSTNSYKRLVPNFEAPTWLAYSHGNRSAAVRVPFVPSNSTAARRIEVRFPDPLANPYLCFASQLMAGLDGIKNKIMPPEVQGRSLYDMSEDEVRGLSSVCFSLEEALEALDKDRGFLVEGSVFTNDQIDAYIKLKRQEAHELRIHPHPVEFSNYYAL
ncbi:type I glutamate--ammonia ligase [Anaplasma phagocytophilum]|uniref:type I glutamate--ammonia ligase n=1 Tax=Anaplasma phagocytophilum TaxID=948 RepID=UPI000533A1D8|nr:type I glutamate--ammonia ligase [Anaplasma phagocytophilum]KDB56399.1 glutamine synthetase [Anaplasma phagocytophilum str. CRT35]